LGFVFFDQFGLVGELLRQSARRVPDVPRSLRNPTLDYCSLIGQAYS
jgi:hypothetical protein